MNRERLLRVRIRPFFLSMDTAADIPVLNQRVRNAFREFGNDWLKSVGLGEFISSWALFGLPNPINYPQAIQIGRAHV